MIVLEGVSIEPIANHNHRFVARDDRTINLYRITFN
jgi:hypothetical protein